MFDGGGCSAAAVLVAAVQPYERTAPTSSFSGSSDTVRAALREIVSRWPVGMDCPSVDVVTGGCTCDAAAADGIAPRVPSIL